MRIGQVALTVALAATAVAPVAGCGGGGGNKKEEEGFRAACKAPRLTGESGLPADFPAPGELTFTKAATAGPTKVVDGYWTSDLHEAYSELKDQIEQAGYKILFDEEEEYDAEISYSGSGRTGQIALRDDCTEDKTTRVHVTSRPA